MKRVACHPGDNGTTGCNGMLLAGQSSVLQSSQAILVWLQMDSPSVSDVGFVHQGAQSSHVFSCHTRKDPRQSWFCALQFGKVFPQIGLPDLDQVW